MKTNWQNELAAAIRSNSSLDRVVFLLRDYKDRGVSREEVVSFLKELRAKTSDEALDDRILEVSDFVAGFCSPHMSIW